MKKKILMVMILTVSICMTSALLAATLYVGTAGTPGGDYYTEIQSAINAAVAGDLILVSNGTYNTGGGYESGSTTKSRVMCTIAIEIRSVDGPDSTFILGEPDPGTGGNGPAAVRGVCLPWDANATISGFTITNGFTRTDGDSNREQGGGGARIRRTCVITNCVIIGNHAYGRAGGLNLQSGVAADCQIINNEAEANTGGGVFAQNSDLSLAPEIHNCLIKGNNAKNNNGGGVYIYGNGKIYNSTISENRCGTAVNVGKGGGVFVLKDGLLQDCTISDNTAHLWGGGICIEDTAHGPGGIVSRCKIQNNTTETHGGAGAMLYNAGEIHDSLISGNTASTHAGGVYYVDGGKVVNCTIVTNVAGGAAGGVVIGSGTSAIINSIVLDNISSDPNTPNWSKGPTGTSLYTCTLPFAMQGVGNLATNAYFVDAAAGDYNLTTPSPCINAGDNAYASSFDLDGKARIVGGTVDMGCYEFIPEPATFGLLVILGLAILRKK